MVEPQPDAAQPLTAGQRRESMPQLMRYRGEQAEVAPGGGRDRKHDGGQDHGEQFSSGHHGNLGPCKAGGNTVPPLFGQGRNTCGESNHRIQGYRRNPGLNVHRSH